MLNLMKLEINKEENKIAELKEIQIGEELKDLQKEVNGLIEIPCIFSELSKYNIDTIINEEGKLENIKTSILIIDKDWRVVDYIAGNIVFAGVNEDGETISLTGEQKEVINKLFELCPTNTSTNVIKIPDDFPKDIATSGSLMRVYFLK